MTRQVARALLPRSWRNWLRAPAKSLHWLWDDGRYRLGARANVEVWPGWSLVCHPAAWRCAYQAQATEPAQVRELAVFLAACTPGMRLLDAGAHFGVFSLAALHFGGPHARAVAVDPSPSACRMLRIQAGLNGLSERLHVVQAALSDHVGTAPMIDLGPLAHGYYAPPNSPRPARELTPTRALTVDEVVTATGLDPTHLKVDVEGAEAAVLRGAQQTLARATAPRLFLELHNQLVREHGGDPAETLALLRTHGYACFADDGTALEEPAILAADLIRLRAMKAPPAGAGPGS